MVIVRNIMVTDEEFTAAKKKIAELEQQIRTNFSETLLLKQAFVDLEHIVSKLVDSGERRIDDIDGATGIGYNEDTDIDLMRRRR